MKGIKQLPKWRFWLFLSIIFLLLLCLFLFFWMTNPNENDKEFYHQLTEQNNSTVQAMDTKQNRTGIQRTFIWNKEGKRYQLLILANASELFLDRQINPETGDVTLEVVENLKGMKCYIQEEIDEKSNQQVILLLESNTAKYKYQTKLLVADDVQLKRISIPGISLLNYVNGGFRNSQEGYQLLMQALAKSIEVSMINQQVNINAKGLRLRGTISSLNKT